MKTRQERKQERLDAIKACNAEPIHKGSLCKKAQQGLCKDEKCPAWADFHLLADVFSIAK